MITNSRLRAFRECPRKEYLSFDLGLEPTTLPEAMRWGSAFHAARAGETYEADPYVRASVERVLAEYREPIDEIVAAEVPFEIPLVNPATGAAAARETLAGTIDAIGRVGSRLWIIERKTTSRPVEDLFARLDIDTQVLTYWIGARALGYDVQGVLYCVQPRPGQRPLKATPIEARKYTQEKIDKKTGEVTPPRLYANQRDRDETPEEYAARLVVEPATFREAPVLNDALLRHQSELWSQHQARMWMRREGHTWRNPQACEDCFFTGICLRSDLETTVPDGFLRRSTPTQARVGQATL